jgi:hypothetical protein
MPSAIIGRMNFEGDAGMTPPGTDALASVLAVVIASNRTAEEIRDHTGVVWDDVNAGIAYLKQRGIIRSIGGEHYHASQILCAGPCSRGGRDLGGQEVVINPKTLRWMCAACWDAEALPNRSVAPSGDRTGEEE